MDHFSLLLLLSRASESCWAMSRSIVKDYGRVPTFSSDPHLAERQAKGRRQTVSFEIKQLAQYMEQWQQCSDALQYVKEAAGCSQKAITIPTDGSSYQTAHETAPIVAQIFVDLVSDITGDT